MSSNMIKYQIVDDFVVCAKLKYGFGYFEGDSLAITIAGTMGKNQIRNYYRREIVPPAFFKYIEELVLYQVNRSRFINLDNKTIFALSDFLWGFQYKDLASQSNGDYLRLQILKAHI